MMDRIVGQLGTITSLANLGAMWAKGAQAASGLAKLSQAVSPFMGNEVLKSPLGARVFIDKLFAGTVGKVFGGISAGLSAYSLFKGVQGMFQTGPSISGALNTGMSVFGLATGVNMLLHVGMLSNPAGWAVAGAVLAGSVAFGSISSMAANGATASGIATAAISTFGVAVLANVAIATVSIAMGGSGTLLLATLLTNPVGWAIAAAVVAIAVIWGLSHQPPSEQVAAEKLNKTLGPIAWSAGPILTVALGTLAVMGGWSHGRIPVSANFNMPMLTFSSRLLQATGASRVELNSKAPTVLVEKGKGTAPTRVMIVSPEGNQLNLQLYTVSNKLNFVSSTASPDCYIPMFVYHGRTATVNTAFTKAMADQNALLNTVFSGNLDTHESMNAVTLAASTTKCGIKPEAWN